MPLHDHPPELLEDTLDVQGAALAHPTIRFGGSSRTASLCAAAVENDVHIGAAGKVSFRTVGRGTLGVSPVEGMQRGAVVWEVTGGDGRLAGAHGLITSNFTVNAQGEVVDDQFARLFVP